MSSSEVLRPGPLPSGPKARGQVLTLLQSHLVGERGRRLGWGSRVGPVLLRSRSETRRSFGPKGPSVLLLPRRIERSLIDPHSVGDWTYPTSGRGSVPRLVLLKYPMRRGPDRSSCQTLDSLYPHRNRYYHPRRVVKIPRLGRG